MERTASIIIHSKGFTCTTAIREYVESRLSRALRRYQADISQVNVYLDDLNGALKGGEDKHVLIQVLLHKCSSVVVEAVSADLYQSISMASGRSRRTIKRSLRRQAQLERKESRKMRSSLIHNSYAEFA